MSLYLKIIEASNQWRDEGYPCEQYPAIKYILQYNYQSDTGYRFLRSPQFQALEIYWYLRLQLKTPHFLELYRHFYPKQSELCAALGIKNNPDLNSRLIDGEKLEDILADKEFITTHRLDSIYESQNLAFASYIMALTMGAGKTILIASIVATEFAMSMEYNGDDNFMKNALIFAPDKTIIGSLREIADTPFEKILPPSDYRSFMTNMKLIYTQDGTKDINGLIEKSFYNIIVTNTQKIIPKKDNKAQTSFADMKLPDRMKQEKKEYTINLRLQRIASLSSIGIFSDEAHHTYGNKVGDELKRVRTAINYIGNETNIICVINTTGTPYSKKKVLKDVVYWYGLTQGIKDNILKSLEKSIKAYSFSSETEQQVIDNVIEDFFTEYGNHTLPNGAPAKIAFYFKNKIHLAECRLIVEQALASIEQPASLILQNTEDSNREELNEFETLNNPTNQKRIILLIQKGTEGWNCPSLFATALIREVTSSNNFILQSSTRCLRQVVGNNKPARIYIEGKNQTILNNELEANFGTSLTELRDNIQEYDTHQVIIKKPNPPRLVITKKIKELRSIENNRKNITLELPNPSETEDDIILKTIYEPNLNPKGALLNRVGTHEEITINNNMLDLFTATKDIANRYRLKYLPILNQLQRLYPKGDIPKQHIFALCKQIDNMQNKFKIYETTITEALALIKVQDEAGNDIFEKNEQGLYCHTIRYKKGSTTYITDENDFENNNHFGFHYAPYHFDSKPEQEFFAEICTSLNAKPNDIEDIYFTGGLTSTRYTDFAFEYKSITGEFKNYYPDFVVLKKNGEFIIIEIKSENKADEHDLEVLIKEKAVRRIENIVGNKFKYHVLYTNSPIPPVKISETENIIFK